MERWKYKFRKLINKKILLPLFFLLIAILNWDKCSNKQNVYYYEPSIHLFLTEQNKCINMPLEEYLIGCVAAEMPSLFEEEALKAQAVCARTYALRKFLDGAKYSGGADLSDNPNDCQAYIDEKTFNQRHSDKSKLLYSKIITAVQETRGIIITYQGEPIDALYHSTCGGKTESAGQVWGKDIPYLRGVKCDYCKGSAYYQKRQEFSWERVRDSLRLAEDAAGVKVMATTDSGRIKTLAIGNQKISAEKLRQSLNLPSVWLDIKAGKNKLLINSRGYGHGVGMCQFGANGLAEQGNDYKKILR
ncbi:MAG: stage II sporulation protein D, partial [Syntrophomonadaceae bacterium]|nr:stage II sporulation protein D [Syntrophomonadaceae bacterium]